MKKKFNWKGLIYEVLRLALAYIAGDQIGTNF